jgi:putative aldouronate transport system permease protein
LYESAIVDGASRWKRVIHITLPAVSSVIVIMLILRVGQIINENFEQIFNLYSPAVYEVGDVFDTFVYRKGIMNNDFSYSTAVGLFKSVTSLVLVLGANFVAKKVGQEGLW